MENQPQDYEQLKQKLQQYEIILAQTENVLFDWDFRSDRIAVSGAWQRIFGYPPRRENIRQMLSDHYIFHPDDVPVLLDRIGDLERGSDYELAETRIITAAGRYLWCRIRATAIRDEQGALEKVVGIIINIDAEKRAAQALQEQAERDPLTKLLNKGAARQRAEEYLGRFPAGTDCALLIIDLDHFKAVNDRYGHLFGDTVLTRTAKEISSLFRSQDIVARIGGDEFMVLMRGVSQRMLVEIRCRQLQQKLGEALREVEQTLCCSIGAALSPEHGKTYVELFQKADRALYRAKNSGRNAFVIYSQKEELRARLTERKTALSSSIDSDDKPELTDSQFFQYAFLQLYTAKDVDAALSGLLALIGQQTNVSRVYIFENSTDNRFCSNTYEWCNTGISPEMEKLQNVSYETDIPGYDRCFDESDIFYCPDIRTLPKNFYDILAPQGICSLLQCAIRENGVFRGYIGFDDCRDYRMWTKEQIRLLKAFSGMLSIFLLRQRSQERQRRQAEELRFILDSRNIWIYIMDPDTFQIQYRNEKVRKDTGAEPGMFCYQALMGRSSRCPGCPAADIRHRKQGQSVLDVPANPLLAEAGLIRWNGREACMVTCREIPQIGKTVTAPEITP